MKKFLVLLMVAMLALCTVAAAEGEAAAPIELVFDETAAAFEGEWFAFVEDGIQIYLPSDWVVGDVPEAMQALGAFGYASSEDGAYVVTFLYNEVGEAADNAAILASVSMQGGTNAAEVLVNGISCVVYDMEAANVSTIAFLDGLGGMYSFAATPASDETFAPIGQTILLSLSPIVTE